MSKLRFISCTMLAIFYTNSIAQDFPVSFEHKYGTTTIERQPIRVATLDWAGSDDLLALGVQPLTTRQWVCKDNKYALCPWAEDKLTSEPLMLGKEYSIDYEAIASTKPDVIIAVWSGITEKDYDQLTKIAPVVAVPNGISDFALPWDERAILTGRIVGKENEAREQVAKIKQQFMDNSCPEWKGKTAAIGYTLGGSVGAISNEDPSMQIVHEFGFVLPESLAKDASGVDFLPLSGEEIGKLDADLLLWIADTETDSDISKLPGYEFLKAHKEGREIILNDDLNAAFRHATLLSLPYAIDGLVPQIKQAIGGCTKDS